MWLNSSTERSLSQSVNYQSGNSKVILDGRNRFVFTGLCLPFPFLLLNPKFAISIHDQSTTAESLVGLSFIFFLAQLFYFNLILMHGQGTSPEYLVGFSFYFPHYRVTFLLFDTELYLSG